MIEDVITKRMDDLIQKGTALRRGDEHGQARGDDHIAECVGWLSAAVHLVSSVSAPGQGSYLASAEKIHASNAGWMIPRTVGEMTALLQHLQADMEVGLLQSVANAVRAETFDDLLDHADKYAREGRIEGSSVLATAVLEDTVRKVCRSSDIDDEGKTLDPMITALQQAGIITPIVAKRLRAGAGVRNSALHARWNEITLDDVRTTISLVREIIGRNLG